MGFCDVLGPQFLEGLTAHMNEGQIGSQGSEELSPGPSLYDLGRTLREGRGWLEGIRYGWV